VWDYLDQNEFTRIVPYETKSRIVRQYFDAHNSLRPADMYRWLWEGEFGPGKAGQSNNVDSLNQDIRLARIHTATSAKKHVFEEAGTAQKFLMINLVPYSDSGCPLMRLLAMADRCRDIRPNPLRFKQDWEFIKTEISAEMRITLDEIRGFENSIPFHQVPEVNYTENYLQEFGHGYILVPRDLFFSYFPEYDPGLSSEALW